MDHTKGPWKIFGEFGTPQEGVNEFIIDSDYGEIAAVKIDYDKLNRPQAKANARLIAAAPEMLAALKMLDDDPGLTVSSNEIIKAAISKATGH